MKYFLTNGGDFSRPTPESDGGFGERMTGTLCNSECDGYTATGFAMNTFVMLSAGGDR